MTPKRETEKKREELQAAADDALTGSVKGSEVRSRKKKNKTAPGSTTPRPTSCGSKASMGVQHESAASGVLWNRTS